MIIRSLSGNTIVKTGHKTLKQTLEYCASCGIPLDGADFRRARLVRANLDGLRAKGASLWGADLEGADIGMADLESADLRNTNLKDTCLAESVLTKADMRGAYFSNTLIEGAQLDKAQVSCPSFWNCRLEVAADVGGLTFWHKGEEAMVLEGVPLTVRSETGDIVFTQNSCLMGGCLYPHTSLPADARQKLFFVKTAIDKILCVSEVRNHTRPNPKISGVSKAF